MVVWYDWFRGRAHDEQLRDGGDRAEDDERRPSPGVSGVSARGSGSDDGRRDAATTKK